MAAQQPQFSPKQVASALHASESSVKRWCDQGAIMTVRTVGGHRRITLDALQNFLRSSNRALPDPSALGLSPARATTSDLIPGGQHEDQKGFRTALAQGDEATCREILQSRIRLSGTVSEAADVSDYRCNARHRGGLGLQQCGRVSGAAGLRHLHSSGQ